MMRSLQNIMRMQATNAFGDRASTRLAIVDSYDPNTYSAKVRIQPEDIISGWLPVLSQWVGNGWGMFAPPAIGDLVEVQFQEDSFQAGLICQRFFNDINRPLNVPSGEFWLQHKSGAFFKLLNNGSATFSDGKGATVTLNGDGTISSTASTWTHTGHLKVTGDITDQIATNSRTLAGVRSVFNAHVHTDPQGGSVSVPTTTM